MVGMAVHNARPMFCMIISRYIHPVAWLYHLCCVCTHFAAFVAAKHHANPSSFSKPWQFIWYADEVTPGNALKATNLRKVWGIYWSGRELGAACLSSEWGWHTLCVLRTSRLKTISLTVLAAKLMELFKEFESGIRLPIAGGIMIVGELKLCVSDEAALKALMECKGASGTLPCMMCSNVVSRNAELSMPGLIHHSSQSLHGVTLHTDDTFHSIVDHLATQKPLLTKKQFGELERNLGFNYVEDGVLARRAFKLSGIQYDWCHCYMVQGIFQLEAVQLSLRKVWCGLSLFM